MKRQLFTLLFISMLIFCQKSPNHVDKAKAFIEINRYEEAINEAELAILSDPKNVDAHLIKGEAYLLFSEPEEASNEFKTAILVGSNVEKKVGSIYFLSALKVIDENSRLARYYFEEAIKKDPSLSKKVSSIYIEKVFSTLESTPNIDSEINENISLALNFTSPEDVSSEKEKLANRLLEQARIRIDKRLIDSGMFLAKQAFILDPSLQNQVIELLLKVAYEDIEKNLDIDVAHNILKEAYNIDNKLIDDSEFYFYYNVRIPDDITELNIQAAMHFIETFKTSPFRKDVLILIIKYNIYNLEIEKAKLYLTSLENEFPKNKFINELKEEINSIENL